ncbi:MAG TPA: choloylglycine hydrolase [Ruminococcaceae bacterium]|jgi:penicillin V acylase-like amidase (Ntn superfamily)|nr:choloylglycine hydrolase [Oscillospiraceae bacterium]
MCTAATYKTNDFYFGRTLDYESSYGEEIVIMPRNFRLEFLSEGICEKHYAVIGTAHIAGGYPLFYDAVNEKGLCMAGLNFVGNAHYFKNKNGKSNIAQYEFIPWILGKCTSTDEAKELISNINITDTPFSEHMPVGQLHWIIADKNSAITVESVSDGIKVYDNPLGVLTNNPPFDEQMFRLNDYMHLSSRQPKNTFSDKLKLKAYSRGMGAIGLPGDLSSQSRFVRVAFVKANSVSGKGETESVSQFFHILGSVDQPRGCCEVADGKYEITIYTSCCNADKGIYYYTTYDNHRISAVDMRKESLDGNELISYPMITEEKINCQN